MHENDGKVLALFDFDGTITQKDSLFHFLKYSVGPIKYYKNIFILIPVFLKLIFQIISNSDAKEKVIAYFFKDLTQQNFKEIADSYSETQINKIIKNSASQKIKWHKSQNHRIIIVSASVECYLQKWCEKKELELIGTKLEFINNKLSGKFLTSNCNGEEKVSRIKEKINLSEYNEIYAYGNSKGDLPMLELANKKFFNNFK
ncbi:MAG: HAD-IB family hydrolase [Ignavibacteriales bacterium]|nr:HAD-IB family hydrolase [Ignavibacteriales bacterium]MCB9210995.1 HAD-IB family hydrolase [Ignavibacteriales bacterium]